MLNLNLKAGQLRTGGSQLPLWERAGQTPTEHVMRGSHQAADCQGLTGLASHQLDGSRALDPLLPARSTENPQSTPGRRPEPHQPVSFSPEAAGNPAAYSVGQQPSANVCRQAARPARKRMKKGETVACVEFSLGSRTVAGWADTTHTVTSPDTPPW